MDQRRYYGLDALRGVAMLLGIVIHSAMFYTVMSSEVVPIKDPRTSPVFDVTILFVHSFRMPLFFLLSGFFACLLVEKYGMRRALWNRALRVFLPFWLGLVTILPLAGWMILSFGLSTDEGRRLLFRTVPEHVEWLRGFARRARLAPSPGHLWFLYYLTMFYALLPLCAWAARRLERPSWRGPLERFTASPLFPLAMSGVTALTLLPYRGAVVEGFQFFRPHLPSLLYYGVFFATGYLLHGYRGFMTTGARHVGAYAAASAALFAAALAPSHFDYVRRGASVPLHLVAVALNAPLTWMLCWAAIGLFQRHCDRDSPWVAYVSQSSYWVYLVHVPLAAFSAWWLVDSDVAALLKFTAVAAFTTAGSFLTYHYLVRRTWVSVLLNGRRFAMDWPWRERGGRAYSTAMGPAA